MMYHEGSFSDMEKQVLFLLNNPKISKEMGKRAYMSIAKQWNAKEGVNRLFDFYKGWKEGKIILPHEGPFSQAKNIPAPKRYD